MIKSDDSRAALGDAQFTTKRVEPRAASPSATKARGGAAANTINALKAGPGAKGGAASTTKNRSSSGRRNAPAAQVGARGGLAAAKKGPAAAKGKKGPATGPMGKATFKGAISTV